MTKDEKFHLLSLKRQKEKILCEGSYFEFFKSAWKILEPETDLILNFHIKYLCDILEKEIKRIVEKRPKTRDIIINIPFRSGKTRIVTELLNAWAWTQWPFLKFLCSSYAADLAIRKTGNTRRLMKSNWFKRNWGGAFEMVGDQNVKSYFQNDKYGFRMATSTGGQATGEGGDVLILDDPINPKMADSETELQNAIDFYEKTMYSRLNDPKVGLRIIIMQRLHEDDLSGHLLAKSPDRYNHICLPGEETKDINPPEAVKYYKNGLFDPIRFSRDILEEHKENLLAWGYSGQILQRPSPNVGGLFKKYNWCFWHPEGMAPKPIRFKDERGEWKSCRQGVLPSDFSDQIQSWDMTFKDTEGTDFVSGGHWARSNADIYLIDEVHSRMDYPTTVKKVQELSLKYKQRNSIYIEDKANGSAVIADLRRSISGIIPVKAEINKVARATPFCRAQTAQNIFIPHPETVGWVWDWIDEFAKFPKGKYDDRVDMASHAYNQINEIYEYENINAKI